MGLPTSSARQVLGRSRRASDRFEAIAKRLERVAEFAQQRGPPRSHAVDWLRLVVNPSLTLAGIPAEAFEYRLGNRSAVEWVIDQYQVSTDKRSGITSDPNREDDAEYIVRLVGQVVRVSLETVEIVKGLPGEFEAEGDEAGASE